MINRVPDRFTCLLVDIKNIRASDLHVCLKTTQLPLSGQELSTTYAAVAGLSYYKHDSYHHVIVTKDKLVDNTISLYTALLYFNTAVDDAILHHFTNTNKTLFPYALEASFSAFEKIIKPRADTCTCTTNIVPPTD